MKMKDDLGLNIQKKNGSQDDPLKGKLVAYATVDEDINIDDKTMQSMIKNGILAVQANYVDQRNIRDFFQAEFGVSLEKGIEEIIDQARDSGGLEGALDPDVVRDKLESMRNMEFIPIPAKIAFFESEEEILERSEDIFYLGHFRVISHAHLCVNSFPILYQAKFREQEHLFVTKEINSMLENLESPPTDIDQPDKNGANIQNFKGDVKDYLLTKIIPKMLYNLDNSKEYNKAKMQFELFMDGFGYPEDTESILNLINSNLKDDAIKLARLELLVEKIEALQAEDYSKLEIIKQKMKKLEK